MIARHVRRWLALAVILAAMVAAAPARAANVTATYCVTYTSLVYGDGPTGNRFVGSSWAAWGVWLRFTNASGTNTDHIMGTNGCKSVTVDAALGPYTVKVLRKASVTGSLVRVVNASGVLLADTIYTSFTPSSGTTYNISTTGDAAHVIAAGTFALASDDAGQDLTFDFILDACPTAPTGSCDRVLVDGRIYILTPQEKFLIVHELGHAISDAADGNLESANDSGAALEGCNPTGGNDPYSVSGYRQNSKEFQSEAAVEGIADYYAGLAFNTSGTNAACMFNELIGAPDWNADGDVTNDEPEAFSCEGGIAIGGDDVPATDYLGWKCLAIGQVNNRATEYDWLRHAWDLDTDYGVTPTTIFAIWGAANPHNWTTTGSGTGGSYPAQRLHDAALAVAGPGLQVSYDTCAAVNGTNR